MSYLYRSGLCVFGGVKILGVDLFLMPKGRPKKTKENPFGLTYKQDLIIRDVTEKVKQGKPMELLDSTQKFYNVKNRNNAYQVAKYNLKLPYFREALLHSLIEKKILGADSVTEQRTIEGLDAITEKGNIDFNARLKYIQEINKIADVYAPERKQTMSLNLDLTEEELDKHIRELQEQLE